MLLSFPTPPSSFQSPVPSCPPSPWPPASPPACPCPTVFPSGGWRADSLSSSPPGFVPELVPPAVVMDGLPGGSTSVTRVIKAGWLDKNPPQG